MSQVDLYSYAKLSKYDLGLFRFLGPGLGNLLFPWARFVVSTKKYGMKPIWPTWPQVKLGTICRWEKDKRFYRGLFECPPDYVSGREKISVLLYHTRLRENDLENWRPDPDHGRDGEVVIFSGIKDYFSTIMTDYKTVEKELIKITLTKHKSGLNYDFRNSISVHIRLGDFHESAEQGQKQASTNVRIPLKWYIQVIDQLRRSFRSLIRVYIFSDARNNELWDVLALPNVHRLTFGSAVADLLGMSQSSLLVASGSTFSMWASYLGRMPVIWYRGHLRQKLYPDQPEAEVECAPDESIPSFFLDFTKSKMCKV